MKHLTVHREYKLSHCSCQLFLIVHIHVRFYGFTFFFLRKNFSVRRPGCEDGTMLTSSMQQLVTGLCQVFSKRHLCLFKFPAVRQHKAPQSPRVEPHDDRSRSDAAWSASTVCHLDVVLGHRHLNLVGEDLHAMTYPVFPPLLAVHTHVKLEYVLLLVVYISFKVDVCFYTLFQLLSEFCIQCLGQLFRF